MKPILAGVMAVGCVSAALAATTVGTQASPSNAAEHRAVAIADARTNALHAHRLGFGAGQSLTVKDTVVDQSGASHVRFERTYDGLPVIGGDFVVHQDARGALKSVSGRSMKPITLASAAGVSARKAANLASGDVTFSPTQSSPELVVLAVDRAPALTWRVEVSGRRADGSPAGEYLFLNANTGKVVDRWASELNETGSGNSLFVGTVPLDTTLSAGTYKLVDPLRGNNETHNGPFSSNAPIYTDADNIWGTGSNSNAQTAGVDAAYGIAKTWDFYKSTFGRNGIANNGLGARSYVHDGAYVNASWSDSCFCMKYGDGDGTTYQPLVELDIAGHEMSHGVTSRTAGLTYRGESGGLNEATSDIFGTMVEFFAGNSNDVGDYVLGEEIFVNYNPATNFIRRLDRPSADGASRDCWSKQLKSLNVHYSSGPANHFFYLLSEGSGAKTINGIAHNSPTCNGSTITGIGRDKAAAIWYRALTVYMTSSTNYAGARVAAVSAATDLYGASSTEVATVKSAWSAVSVA
jgi:Zn-dependent metalloprotease